SRSCLALYRNTTEAINAVMYSLLTEFRDGDNVVITMLEHDSNFVPWYAMCREILPRFGRRVDYRLARFDPATGELDLGHLASLLRSLLPFLYGGGMAASGQVLPGHVEYGALPGKYHAATPDIPGTIASAEAIRLLMDLALSPGRPVYSGTGRPVTRATAWAA